MLISHTPVRGVILKYFGENHTLCVKFEPNWTRCKQLEEGIKSLACGSWFYPFLSLFANSFNLERYSSRGGQEKPLGWRLGVFLDHHSMNILINTPRSNKILPRVLPKYSRLRLEYFGRTLGSILLLLGVFISNFTIVWFSLKYFRQNIQVWSFLLTDNLLSIVMICHTLIFLNILVNTGGYTLTVWCSVKICLTCLTKQFQNFCQSQCLFDISVLIS